MAPMVVVGSTFERAPARRTGGWNMKTIDEIKQANRNLGHHWFDAGTMRFFATRICNETVEELPDGGALFVTSEKPPHGERAYAVRRAKPNGEVETVGRICTYRTRQQAIAALKEVLDSYRAHHWCNVVPHGGARS